MDDAIRIATDIVDQACLPEHYIINGVYTAMRDDIARAIHAERERCAKMADDKAATYEAEAGMWPCAPPIAVRLRGLAKAIRA